MKAFFDMIHRKPDKYMLFGAACTQVTDPIAKTSKFWHLTQVSGRWAFKTLSHLRQRFMHDLLPLAISSLLERFAVQGQGWGRVPVAGGLVTDY